MATNYKQPGSTITLAAPYDRTTGQGALVGSIFGVALTTVLSGANAEFGTEGVWELTKTSAQAWTQGQKIYWDNSNKRCDSDSTVGQLIGTATEAAANPSSTGIVRLNGNAPATAEGPQAAIVALTDSTGASGSHDDTVADGLTLTALTDNGGGTADGTVASQAAPVTLTDSTGQSGTHDDTLAATTVPADLTGGESPTEAEHNAVLALLRVMTQNASDTAQKVIELVTLATTAQNNLKEVTTQLATILTDLTVQNQNDSDIAQKVLEIRTALINAGIIAA